MNKITSYFHVFLYVTIIINLILSSSLCVFAAKKKKSITELIPILVVEVSEEPPTIGTKFIIKICDFFRGPIISYLLLKVVGYLYYETSFPQFHIFEFIQNYLSGFSFLSSFCPDKKIPQYGRILKFYTLFLFFRFIFMMLPISWNTYGFLGINIPGFQRAPVLAHRFARRVKERPSRKYNKLLVTYFPPDEPLNTNSLTNGRFPSSFRNTHSITLALIICSLQDLSTAEPRLFDYLFNLYLFGLIYNFALPAGSFGIRSYLGNFRLLWLLTSVPLLFYSVYRHLMTYPKSLSEAVISFSMYLSILLSIVIIGPILDAIYDLFYKKQDNDVDDERFIQTFDRYKISTLINLILYVVQLMGICELVPLVPFQARSN